MIYEAKVLSLDDDLEEEVLLRIGMAELICFASVCPYAIQKNEYYSVELRLVVLNECAVTEQPQGTVQSIARIDRGFSHVVTGVLKDGCLESVGFIFEYEVLARDFGYLNGKPISLRVDRIDAEFL